MPLDLSVTRGPLTDEALGAIAATYGTVDPRYASRDFCRILFNENPIGYSYHAFVRDGETVVGHYSVIPMRVRARGTTVISGKGEALFLSPPYRATPVVTPAGEVLAGIAMMKSLHDYALADGLTFIHSITSPGVGMILRMNGSRALRLSLDQVHFMVQAPKRARVLSRAQGARLLAGGQRVLLAATRAGLRVSAAPEVEVNSSTHEMQSLVALAGTDSGDGATWSISRDLETLKWMRRVGRLDVVSIIGRPEHFAIVTRGDSRELLLWSVPPGSRRNGLAIVCGLLSETVRQGGRVLSLSRRVVIGGGSSLRLALRLLGFYPKKIPITIYTKSRDDFYLQSATVDFSRLFNL